MTLRPRGIRNNNPGNIRHSGSDWQGMSKHQTDQAFVQFQTPEHGIRALHKVLQTYQSKHGLNTVKKIIDRWAPPNENNTKAYIDAVAEDIGVSPYDPVDVMDPDTAIALVSAIIHHENGEQPYGKSTIREGLRMAGVEQIQDSNQTPAPAADIHVEDEEDSQTHKSNQTAPPADEKANPEAVPEGKNAAKDMTIWGCILTVGPDILAKFGIEIPPEILTEAKFFINSVNWGEVFMQDWHVIAGIALVVAGRATAGEPLRLPMLLKLLKRKLK